MTSPLDLIAGMAPPCRAVVHASSRAPGGVPPVSSSGELHRICSIPTRELIRDKLAAAHQRVRELVYKPVNRPREYELRWEQPDALAEALLFRGLWAPIGVGRGKTLVATLIPSVLQLGPAVILTNAGLVKQVRVMMDEYSKEYFVRRDITVLSYSILSSPTSFEVLDRLKPLLIVADECQAISNADAARTKRFNRYMKAHPETIFCAMSGSVTRKSIKEFAHLMGLALGDRTPLPRDWKTLTEWAEALDVSDRPRPPGGIAELIGTEQLAAFCGTEDPHAIKKARMYVNAMFLRGHNWDSEESAQVVDMAREAVQRRISATPGVVASTESSLEAGLEIEVLPKPECPLIAETLKQVADMWERPDGELLTYALELARVTRHVRQGGYYRWVWPKTVTDERKRDWLEARRDYRKELREFLKGDAKPGLDSPFLVEQAIKRGEVDFTFYDRWRDQRTEMRAELRGETEPPSEWVWVSKAYAEGAAEMAKSVGTCVVWSGTRAVGMEVAKLLDCPWYGAGPEAAEGIIKERGTRTIGASIRAHGTGRNLQKFSQALVLDWPPSGAAAEQMLGRHHRAGQEAEAVRFRLFNAFDRELKLSRRDAKYIQSSTGNQQKILTAEIIGENGEDE